MNTLVSAFPDGQPPGLVSADFHHKFQVKAAKHEVWAWLNDPRTFIDKQPPPYRVEFIPEKFDVGVFNNHHGPFLNLPAVITAMEGNDYREMRYLYGSFVLGLRLIRPTAIKFWLVHTHEGGTELQLALESLVHPWIRTPWLFAQKIFWKSFGATIERGIQQRSKERSA
ncbi:MAG: hypothetical protein VYC39_18605 [Myxococcota bacterium]|nr:hypothetical protein [Myxococcota bacterium]